MRDQFCDKSDIPHELFWSNRLQKLLIWWKRLTKLSRINNLCYFNCCLYGQSFPKPIDRTQNIDKVQTNDCMYLLTTERTNMGPITVIYDRHSFEREYNIYMQWSVSLYRTQNEVIPQVMNDFHVVHTYYVMRIFGIEQRFEYIYFFNKMYSTHIIWN